MADYDILESKLPHNANRRPAMYSVMNLRTALSTFNATYYNTAMLNGMTKRDMVYACRVNGLTIAGTPL